MLVPYYKVLPPRHLGANGDQRTVGWALDLAMRPEQSFGNVQLVIVGERGLVMLRGSKWKYFAPLRELGIERGVPAGVSFGVNDILVVGGRNAFRWSFLERSLEDLGTLRGHNRSYAQAISSDGKVIVGYSIKDSEDHEQRSVRWTIDDGIEELRMFRRGKRSRALSVSVDGGVIVGFCSGPGFENAFRWTAQDDRMEDLGVLPDCCAATATGVSADGKVAVGEAHTERPGMTFKAWRWIETIGNMEELGVLPGYHDSYATAVSADGEIVIGYCSNGYDRGGWHRNYSEAKAFIWSSDGGMQSISDILIEQGVREPTRLTYYSGTLANAIAREGEVCHIVGAGLGGAGYGSGGWYARVRL